MLPAEIFTQHAKHKDENKAVRIRLMKQQQKPI